MIKTHQELIDIAVTFTRYSYKELAETIGTSKQNLNQMYKRNSIPKKWWPKIEKATNGKVKVRQLERGAL